MRYLLGLLLIALAASAVPELTSSNILNQLASNEFLFVKFYSPHCAHCTAMAPQFELFYQQSEGKGYKVYEMDCTQHREYCLDSGVRAFPTLQLFVSGTSYIYEGPRTAEAMAAWMEDLRNTTLVEPNTEQMKKKIGKETFVIISGLSQKARRSIAIARKLNDFGITFYTFLAQGYIRLYKNGSEQPLTYQTDQDFPLSLIYWSFEEGRAPITHVTKGIRQYIEKQKKFKYLLGIIDNGQDSPNLKILNDWCEASFKDILCVRITPDSSSYDELKEKAKVQGDRTAIFISKTDFSVGYHYPQQEITAQGLTSFYENAKADKLYRAIDIQRDIRERIKYTNVVRLTPETYRQAIAENEYIFIEYYAPTCGHCVKFAPDYEQVGTHFKNINSSIVIAALDLTDEEDGIMKQEGIKGYPHFRFFIRGNVVLYRKPRSAESIIKFITDLHAAKFRKVDSLQEITERPFVTISGIEEDSYLNAIVGLTQYPIYHVSSQGSLSIKLHAKTAKQYEGKTDVWRIVDWLDIESCPIVSSIGEPTPNKRIENALIKHIPLLIFANKHERNSVDNIIQLLEAYCEDKTAFVCGYFHNGDEDYKMLLEWFGDNDAETNRLFWVNTDKSLKYQYEGDLNSLTHTAIDQFIRAVRAGQVPQFGAKKPTKTVQTNEEL